MSDAQFELVEQRTTLATRNGCGLAQLAIAWPLSSAGVSSVMGGVTKMEHLEDNAGAASISFSDDELQELDALTRP